MDEGSERKRVFGEEEWPKDGKERTGRIQSIDINTQIYRSLGPHPIADLLNNARRPDRVDLPRLHNLEAAVSVVVVIR